MAKKPGIKLIANNKKAFHDYFIEDTYEAGIALAGTEVKSLRMGKCSVKESFVRIQNGEVYIYTKKAIFSIKIPFVSVNFSFTAVRSTRWKPN